MPAGNSPPLVVVDTNIFIAFLIGKKLVSLKEKILQKEFIIIVSDELLHEIFEVVSRKKFQKYFAHWQIKELFSLLEKTARNVKVSSSVKICKDEKDDFLLSLCKDGNADYLVTGDKDLLEINIFINTEIISLRNFSNLISK